MELIGAAGFSPRIGMRQRGMKSCSASIMAPANSGASSKAPGTLENLVAQGSEWRAATDSDDHYVYAIAL